MANKFVRYMTDPQAWINYYTDQAKEQQKTRNILFSSNIIPKLEKQSHEQGLVTIVSPTQRVVEQTKDLKLREENKEPYNTLSLPEREQLTLGTLPVNPKTAKKYIEQKAIEGYKRKTKKLIKNNSTIKKPKSKGKRYIRKDWFGVY